MSDPIINENFFRKFLDYVELNLLASIRASIALLAPDDGVRVSTTENRNNSIFYFDGRREVSDQIIIEVTFLASNDD
ncbi:MAG: hypothetical protein KF744_10340 [Taibaiella sp.]|nr:hypothetical protein [Taibaiella sp.]